MPALYDTIGTTYGATRRADPTIVDTLARLVELREDASLLDLACGTGNYTCAMAARDGRWHGVDVSSEMLDKAAARSPEIAWTLAPADALPFPDGTFDGAICTLAIHHFPDLLAPFREVHRALRGGRFVIFTSFPDQMRGYWLNRYFPVMMEHATLQMPSREMVLGALADAGFTLREIVPFDVPADLQDLFLYAGKARPELYFNEIFRANISSFALYAPPEEVRAGLDALRADIETGGFEEMARAYGSDTGDYAYVVAEKERG